MIETAPVSIERVELAVADGTTMFAHVAHPPAPAPAQNAPGIMVFQDAFGITPFLRDVVVRFAELGFLAIAPELYHRTGCSELPYDDIEMKLSVPHRTQMTAAGMVADAQASYDWLCAQGVAADRVCAIGFCMGGRLAYLANAELPLATAISFYGGGVQKSLDLATKQHGPLLMLWGGEDEHIPNEQHWEVARALTEAGTRHEQVFFSHGKHGFFCHVRPWLYDADYSRQAWALVLEMLRSVNVLPEPALTRGG